MICSWNRLFFFFCVCHHEIFHFLKEVRYWFASTFCCFHCRSLWSPRRKLTNRICIWRSQCGICNHSALQKDLLGVKGIVKIRNVNANPNGAFAKIEIAECWKKLSEGCKKIRRSPPSKNKQTNNKPRTIDDFYLHAFIMTVCMASKIHKNLCSVVAPFERLKCWGYKQCVRRCRECHLGCEPWCQRSQRHLPPLGSCSSIFFWKIKHNLAARQQSLSSSCSASRPAQVQHMSPPKSLCSCDL